MFDYDESKDTTKCKGYNVNKKEATGCGAVIKKRLHNLVGAVISKNDEGQYVLAFPEYRETDIYPSWDLLKEAMDKLAKNDNINDFKKDCYECKEYGYCKHNPVKYNYEGCYHWVKP